MPARSSTPSAPATAIPSRRPRPASPPSSASELNAFSHVDPERALERRRGRRRVAALRRRAHGRQGARQGGGLARHRGIGRLPRTASPTTTGTHDRPPRSPAAPSSSACARPSEFGGLNVSTTKLNGTTHNPWEHGRTAGGSSGGSSSAVAGGLVPIATGGDGGGSIRIPAGFNGLVGMKGTAGRIPRGPKTEIAPLTVVKGCQARSVRDVARWYDVCAGYDMPRPVLAAPASTAGSADLGTHDLAGMRVVVAPDLGKAVLRPEVEAQRPRRGRGADRRRRPRRGRRRRSSSPASASSGRWRTWPSSPSDLERPLARLQGRPHQGDGLRPRDGLRAATTSQMAATVEKARTAMNEAMAAVFDEVDFVICATNPDVAFPADITANTRVGEQQGRPGEQRRADHPGQHRRQPGDLGAGRAARRPAGGHADHGPPPRGRPAARPGPHRRAHAALAARSPPVVTSLTRTFAASVG